MKATWRRARPARSAAAGSSTGQGWPVFHQLREQFVPDGIGHPLGTWDNRRVLENKLESVQGQLKRGSVPAEGVEELEARHDVNVIQFLRDPIDQDYRHIVTDGSRAAFTPGT